MDYKYWIEKWQNENIFNIDADRNKPKSYVFSFFPKANLNGFQDAGFRKFIVLDVFARYKRQRGENVLFPTGVDSLANSSFIESKRQYGKLTFDLDDKYYNDMLNLGIGINSMKHISMRDVQYVEALQTCFIDLYDRKYIKYDNRYVYLDKKNDKIIDSRFNLDLPKVKEDVFYLDIKNIIEPLVNNIKKLDQEYQDMFLNLLHPRKYMVLNLLLSNGEEIVYKTDSPEYLAGLSFILINPEFVDIGKYCLYDEIYGVMEYLDGKIDSFGVFSGLFATNPLTGNNIPVFISLLHKCEFYFGNPSIDEDDLALVINEEIPYNNILEKNVLINSDFLSHLDPASAKELIFNEFTEAEVCTLKEEYDNEILVSSKDNFGALFPFLIDTDTKKLYSLENHLPYIFSSKLRPILPDDIDIVGSQIEGTINSSFVNGCSVILNILYDRLGQVSHIFDKDSLKEIKDFNCVDYLALSKSDLESCLISIIIYTILEKEENISFKRIFNKLEFYEECIDAKGRLFKKNNNNFINLEHLFNSHYHDSLRMISIDEKPSNTLVFYPDYLNEYDEIITKIKLISTNISDKNINEFEFYELEKKLTKSLDKYDLASYFTDIKDFILNTDTLSLKQLKDLLIIIYPLMPFLSEELYKEIFRSKYSIINEDWPIE